MLQRSLLIATIGLATVFGDIEDFCGYAPLCGDGDVEFNWQEGALSDGLDGTALFGAELTMTDCCKLSDTTAVEDCQIVDPSGESYRTLTSADELCGFRGADCQEGECNEYQIVIKPQFATESSNEGCCDSCTCFGDPQCIAFNGQERIWALCDGREVPREESIWEMCRITKNQCDEELDHAGNQCTYLADDIRGRDWVVGKQGSPCQPNADSPASIITMYEVEDVNFKLSLEQAERGIIKRVILEMECGNFELSAEDCIANGEDAWESDSSLPEFFSYNDVVKGYDQHWSLVDPDSGISLSVRCHANRYDGDDTSYVPRINIEDLSDPIGRGDGGAGFCVDGDFEYGQATTDNTRAISANDLCDEGLQDSNVREIYRAMCRNPSLPSSAHDSCVYHFCNRHYLPLFESMEECEETFASSVAEGFCKGVTYSEADTTKCVDQWFDIGAVETIQQYYDDQQGCTTELQTTLDKCQSGIIIQYYRNDQWNDEIAIPSDFCSDEDIILSYCDHQYLFNRRVRILQKTANIACGPVNQCTTVEGFLGTIELVKNTPFPTNFPTQEPTDQPTGFPTPFPISPTEFPTTFPTEIGVITPTICPEEPLCSTNNEDVLYDEDQVMFELSECCVETESVCDSEATRTQTAPEWYCGLSDGAEGTVEDSVAGISCEDQNELQISVMFSHETECCQKCTCYGDPRCYSFDGSFEEFILCDGRTPAEEEGDRCIIRRDTCLEQRDHDGNACAWTNPLETPPNYITESIQEKAEREYAVSRYGSPCRYDTTVSPTASVLMYETNDPYRLEVDQGERGYIQTVHLTTDSGEFQITAERCLDGDDWEVMSGSAFDMSFTRSSFGLEYLWTVEDKVTKIVLKIRCTGNTYQGSYSNTFINVEALLDWDDSRVSDSEGFCATNDMPEKNLASTSYSDSLRDNNLCSNWNEDSSEVIRREVARVITNNPGVTTIGTESAFREFCATFFSPTWTSVTRCVNAFMNADTVKETMAVFCSAVTSETGPCEENLEVLAEHGGYKESFRDGYETYVINFQQQCEVKFGDLPETLTFDEDTCQTGVELQFYNPRKLEWITYAAFPDTGGYCKGYRVKALYDYHPKLFKNPLRLIQKHNTEFCNQCTQVSAVQAFISFSSEPEGSF